MPCVEKNQKISNRGGGGGAGGGGHNYSELESSCPKRSCKKSMGTLRW